MSGKHADAIIEDRMLYHDISWQWLSYPELDQGLGPYESYEWLSTIYVQEHTKEE